MERPVVVRVCYDIKLWQVKYDSFGSVDAF